MKTQLAEVGSRGVDSYPYCLAGTEEQAKALRVSGLDFFVGYLGVITPGRLKYILDSGMAFMPVTLAGRYSGPEAVASCVKLGLPKGCTVWLDLEGQASYVMPPAELIAKINAWAKAMIAAGYQPGLYIGSPQPLTAAELYQLAVVRYWKAPSRVVDRNGVIHDGPKCGFCMYQLWDSRKWRRTGVFVDVDFIQKDFQGRLPSWVVA
jgi:hypothetical protein